jgi:hypothetical protein
MYLEIIEILLRGFCVGVAASWRLTPRETISSPT